VRMVVAIALAGCVSRIDITHVVLRDRTRVAVAMGSATILPVGSDRAELRPGATIARGGYDGRAIYISCPDCTSGGVYVAEHRELDLLGSASELLSFDGDDVRVHWSSKYRNHRGRVLFAEPNVALDLITPRDNVASIDYERHIPGPRTPLFSVIFTAALATGAASMIGLGVDERAAIPIVVGSVTGAAFAAVFALVLGDYVAHDIHQAIAL
jgi:hypothetical protein